MTAAKQNLTASERDPFRRAWEWHCRLPRAGRWAVGAGAVLMGFVLLDSVLWPIAERMHARADRLAGVLDAAATRADGLPEPVSATALAYGPNAPIGFETQGMKRLAEAIDKALRAKGVQKYGQDMRRAQPMPGGAAAAVAATLGGTLTRSVADLSFEATPNDVNSIIAALDADPDVDCITDLKLAYNPATKRVKVQMMLEKWGVSKAPPPKGSV